MWSARHSPLNLASRLLPVFFFMMYSHTINTIPISSIGFSVSSTGSTMSFANPKPSYDTVLGQKKLPKKSNQCVVNSWKEWGFLNPCLKHLRQELEWDHKPINSTLSSTSHSQLWEVYLGSSSCIWCVNLLATVVDFGTCLEMITGGKVVKIYIYMLYCHWNGLDVRLLKVSYLFKPMSKARRLSKGATYHWSRAGETKKW